MSKINDKDILVLFGTTGSGKSTLANALISGVQNIEKQKETGYFIAKKILKNDDGDIIFQIGHQVKSETKAPKFYPM